MIPSIMAGLAARSGVAVLSHRRDWCGGPSAGVDSLKGRPDQLRNATREKPGASHAH